MKYFLILAILFCSCKVRKVDTQISKSYEKSSVSEETKLKEKSETISTDKSISKVESKNQTLYMEDDSIQIVADKIVFDDKGKVKEALGNAKFSKRTNTRKSNNIQSTGTLQADKVTNTNLVRDSVGNKNNKSETKNKDKVKKTEVKSVSWVWLLPILGILIGGYIWLRFKK